MLDLEFDISDIFKINSNYEFNDLSLKIFQLQAKQNSVYKEFLAHLNVNPKHITTVEKIPFLPIDFFKTHRVLCNEKPVEKIFKSSGTTKNNRSEHYIYDLSIYKKSFIDGFKYFYGAPKEICFLALLPNYLDQGDSSLVFMMKELIEMSNDADSAFYLNNTGQLHKTLLKKESEGKKCILIGVTYALLDFSEKYSMDLHYTTVMETGGMKGRRKEMIREEVHQTLKKGFGVDKIHSEYGMTELLSQAYSKGDGVFETPNWMRILTRSTNDPFTLSTKKSGAINVIDLSNINSCSFIATQDIGKLHSENTFEVLGRTDNSDIRGCNLMVV